MPAFGDAFGSGCAAVGREAKQTKVEDHLLEGLSEASSEVLELVI